MKVKQNIEISKEGGDSREGCGDSRMGGGIPR